MFFSRIFLTIALLSCGSSACVDEAESEWCIGFIERVARGEGFEGLQQLLQEFPGQEDIMCVLLDERRERGSVSAHLPIEFALHDFYELLQNLPKQP